MTDIVKCCAILHNMIVEARDVDGSMGTKNIVSIDPSAEVIPIRAQTETRDRYAEAAYLQENADRFDDRHDHEMLTKALMDSMWQRLGDGDAVE